MSDEISARGESGPEPTPNPEGETPVSPAPAAKPKPISLATYLYNHNPFYALSALLVFWGLHLAIHDPELNADPNTVAAASWIYLGVLGLFAALLVGTGIAIVRWGVWEDARILLLTVLLLLVAGSVSFDHLLLNHSATVSQLLAAGWLLAAGMIEVALRGTKLRLRAGYRVPLHLAMALFFLYPVLQLFVLDRIGGENNELGRSWTPWLCYLFPFAAALVGLTLLPAASRGPAYVEGNGSPWKWPLFPWSIFTFLGAATVIRSYYLSISFDPKPAWDSIFGMYFLIPLWLSACAVIFTAARSTGNRSVMNQALAAAPVAMLLAIPGNVDFEKGRVSFTYLYFLQDYKAALGPPVWGAWLGMTLFYAGARLAGSVTAGRLAIAALLFGGIWWGPATIREVQVAPYPWVALTGALAAGAAVIRAPRSAAWLLVLLVAGLEALAGFLRPLSGNLTQDRALVALHLALLAAMIIGVWGRDALAKVLPELLSAIGLALVLISYWLIEKQSGYGPGAVYVASTLVFFAAWGWAWRQTAYWWIVGLCVFVGVVYALPGAIRATFRYLLAVIAKIHNPAAVFLVAGGAVSFLVALAISRRKAKALAAKSE
ncbi:MAG TPA: hypothetical protein VNC50_22410 [Planctomycetia bacterium]|nr:hypothetical protein [Planctomycetia bacterium]